MSTEEQAYIVEGEEGGQPAIETPETEPTKVEPETKGGEEDGGEPEGEPTPKKKSGVQRLKAHLEEERNARIQREQELARLQEELEAVKSPGKPSMPKEEAFEKYTEYQEALAKYHEDLTDWKIGELKREQVKQAEQRQHEEAERTFTGKIKAAHDAHEDLHDLLESALEAGIPITPAIDAFLRESDTPGEILYQLAKNQDEFKRISGLSPTRQIAALGKIEDGLTAKTIEPKPKTNAPKPPTPLKGGTSEIVKPDKDGYEVY